MLPVRAAIGILERAREAAPTDAALVAFSGGKDSCACLALASRVFKRVEAFFMYMVPGLECEEGFAKRIAARYGVELHTYPNPGTTQALKNAFLTLPRNGAAHRMRDMRYVDVERAARADTDTRMVVLGWRERDSHKRRAILRRWGTVDVPHGRC